jgi:PHP family Zn ribbon phosphoesterase
MPPMSNPETSTGNATQEAEALIKQSPGALYLRSDLQVHTPIDPAFEPGPEPKEASARRALAEEYLGKAKERGIELVGITEHNDVSWIEELRAAAHKLDLHLLPGFEVESREGVHVLCLFEPDTSVSHLEDTLVQLGLTAAKRKSNRLELRTKQSFAELLDLVQEDCAGICIAAHIESNKGLLAALREGARVDAWKTKGLLAAQVAKPPDQISSGNGRIIRGEDPIYDRGRLPGYVLTSDCRSLEKIGTVSTWIKMDAVGVNGLRQAFLDPESRISFQDPAERRTGARLLAAAWEGDFLDGVSFRFNPELNCLIGGKGTGKSTAIETIRYALDLEYRTSEVERAAAELRDHAFRSGSKVSLVVETDKPKRRYVIERTAPHAPVVRNMDGSPQPDLDARTLLSPRIYGQKEIFGIAQNAQARLEMIDGFAADELRQVADQEAKLLARCEENGALIVRTLRRLDESESKLSELPNLEEWRQRFREAGFEKLLAERRQLDREGRLLQAGETSVKELAARLTALKNGAEVDLSSALDSPADEPLPNADLVDQAKKILTDANSKYEKGIDALVDDLNQTRNELAAVQKEWAGRREDRAADFDKALRTLQERAPDVDPERYLDIERRIEQLMPLRTALGDLRSRLKEARHERSRLLVELTDVRGEKHRARKRAADRLNDALAGNVRIEVEHQGIRDPFIERLQNLKTKTRQDALRNLVESATFSPQAFVAAVRSSTLEEEFGMPAGQASNLVRALEEDVLLDLELEELSDRVALALDVAVGEKHRDYRDLSRLSPGQKSTAILLLVMQESVDPLLIDQPEDDLDNRFIYDDIVMRLKQAKPARQFVIATHNANIPVLGDAEQIVALDAEEKGGAGRVSSFIRAHGSIDAENVRDAAEHILEGGHEAFELRRAKYET